MGWVEEGGCGSGSGGWGGERWCWDGGDGGGGWLDECELFLCMILFCKWRDVCLVVLFIIWRVGVVVGSGDGEFYMFYRLNKFGWLWLSGMRFNWGIRLLGLLLN